MNQPAESPSDNPAVHLAMTAARGPVQTRSVSAFANQSRNIITFNSRRDNVILAWQGGKPNNRAVPRRVHIPSLAVGDIDLADSQARACARFAPPGRGPDRRGFRRRRRHRGSDDSHCDSARSDPSYRSDHPPAAREFTWTVASAVPKGPRADWMVEKLSELGATAFVPLQTARSVAMPSGSGKLDRWSRLAAEAAKQCGRPGVMRIEPLTPVADVISSIGPGHSPGISQQNPTPRQSRD